MNRRTDAFLNTLTEIISNSLALNQSMNIMASSVKVTYTRIKPSKINETISSSSSQINIPPICSIIEKQMDCSKPITQQVNLDVFFSYFYYDLS